MEEIKLEKNNWFFDPKQPLGKKGGFGQVFFGEDSDGNEVAVKRLYITSEEAGHRELSLAKELASRNHDHIIKVFDSGIDAESGNYFIVMAKAEHSLQDVIDDKTFPEEESIEIFHQIALGLEETKDIVHRDLKPDNILLEDGKWKIADFGIAKFVEESTSINTLKECMTAYYAAPEQWRHESTTKATDIYALGCITHTLLTGSPPFLGSNRNIIRLKHLNETPPDLKVSPQFQQLISLTLRKSHQSRPSLKSTLSQIDKLKSNSTSNSSIAQAGKKIAKKEAHEEAEKVKAQTQKEKRKQLARDAFENFKLIVNQLFQHVKDQAPVAKMYSDQVQLGSGKIIVSESFKLISKDSFSVSGLDIICGATIKIVQENSRYPGRASNLWYMKRGESYRWYEVAYWTLGQNNKTHRPFAIERESEFSDADYAASRTMHSVNQAFNPKIIDGEYTSDFIERWANRLAAASSNNLQRPSKLPED